MTHTTHDPAASTSPVPPALSALSAADGGRLGPFAALAAGVGPFRRRFLPEVAGIGDPGHVALTFDDGPHPDATPDLLMLLGNAGVHATFFLLGRQAARYPSIVREIVAAGHELGVHGDEHRLLLKRGPGATRDDLRRGLDTISEISGVRPQWWRPPYGAGTPSAYNAARNLGLRPVLWTTWGRDWTASCTGVSVQNTVLRGLRGGGTILLHDSDHSAAPKCWVAMLSAVPGILTACSASGWDVGPLRDHGLA